MAVSQVLTEFLRENLDKVRAPDSYASLRQKLRESRPTQTAPAIEQSPENSARIGNSAGER
jgi:hypothetical protein